MKQAFILTITFLLAATTIAAQSANTKVEQKFRRLHLLEEEAEAKKDIAALDLLLNDDFIFIAANGSISDKKKFLDDIKADEPAASALPKLAYEDFKVRVYAKTAIVNYVLLVSGTDKNGKAYANRYRMSVLWIKQKQTWRISNFHATRMRP